MKIDCDGVTIIGGKKAFDTIEDDQWKFIII